MVNEHPNVWEGSPIREPLFPHSSEINYLKRRDYKMREIAVAIMALDHLHLSFDYHYTLTEIGTKYIPQDSVEELKCAISRLQIILGNKLSYVINTAGTEENILTDLGMPIIERNGTIYRERPKANPKKLAQRDQFTQFEQTGLKVGKRSRELGLETIIVSDDYFYVDLPFDSSISADELVAQILTREEAQNLVVWIDFKRNRIGFYPRSFKEQGNIKYLNLKGIDPKSTAIIHFGDDFIDIPTEGVTTSTGAYIFVVPNNAEAIAKKHASYLSEKNSPDMVIDFLNRLSFNLSVLKLTQYLKTGIDNIEVKSDLIRIFKAAVRRATVRFRVAPTLEITFQELERIFGFTLKEWHRQRIIKAIGLDPDQDIDSQIMVMGGINPESFGKTWMRGNFGDHPLSAKGVTFMANRIEGNAGEIPNPVIFDRKEYEQALLESAGLTIRLADLIRKEFGNESNLVLLSLYRGGIYPAIGIQFAYRHGHGIDLPHYSIVPNKHKEPISIFSREDPLPNTIAGETLAYLLSNHPKGIFLIVDGWVGSGEILKSLKKFFSELKTRRGLDFKLRTATLLDPIGVSDFTATREDTMLGWNLLPKNDDTHAFHPSKTGDGRRMPLISPNPDAYSTARLRLEAWFEMLSKASSNNIDLNEPTLSLNESGYIEKALSAMGFLPAQFDRRLFKFGINEAYMRLHNDESEIWKFLVINPQAKATLGMKKLLELARLRSVEITESNSLPCQAALSIQRPFINL
ncbi:hypothetical protein A3F57_01985 [Candidatus Roizmanbacteria bacterium RIFCSPHIGHO2_12_FULL_36_11]|nr:MAG: hypothetical protein A3F57_01985 [Candidatus Roizmanbacteria bacterium RIFCSPHIGHO2_12_FULL_36_11]